MPRPARRRIQTTFPDDGRTRQEGKDPSDINLIMAKYNETGILPRTNPMTPQYGDYSNVPDYMAAQQIVIDAQDAFASLPSAIRDRLGNDPLNMVTFLNDPANAEEAALLGLTEPLVQPAAQGPDLGNDPLDLTPKTTPISGGE